MHKTKVRKLGSVLAIDLRRDGHVVAPENIALSLSDPLFEEFRRDGALVDIEEGDVVVGDLMKEDDELHKVGVCLLPEGFLATAKKVIQKRSNVVGQSVGVEVIVERVVAVFGIETDFDVVLSPLVAVEDGLYLAAKVALNLED